MRVTPAVDGIRRELDVEPHRTLAAVLHEDCGVAGVRVDCADGTCGACTVRVDGDVIRSCLMLAVQADQAQVRTDQNVTAQRVAEM